MKTKTLSYTPILFCILILWSACKDDADAPLRFYDSKYEVPMGGRRYLGIESGNGDYSLEIGNPRIASAGIESGWSGVPAGRMIYISGILTGSTYLKVTDNATQETLTLPIKVVDYYEDLNLIHGSSSLRPNGDENLLPGVDDIFLVSNAARDAYFFKQGQQTAFSSGLELITKGTYALKQGHTDPYFLIGCLTGYGTPFHRMGKRVPASPAGQELTSELGHAAHWRNTDITCPASGLHTGRNNGRSRTGNRQTGRFHSEL